MVMHLTIVNTFNRLTDKNIILYIKPINLSYIMICHEGEHTVFNVVNTPIFPFLFTGLQCFHRNILVISQLLPTSYKPVASYIII